MVSLVSTSETNPKLNFVVLSTDPLTIKYPRKNRQSCRMGSLVTTGCKLNFGSCRGIKVE